MIAPSLHFVREFIVVSLTSLYFHDIHDEKLGVIILYAVALFSETERQRDMYSKIRGRCETGLATMTDRRKTGPATMKRAGNSLLRRRVRERPPGHLGLPHV